MKMVKVFAMMLDSGEYVQIRNALLVLAKIVHVSGWAIVLLLLKLHCHAACCVGHGPVPYATHCLDMHG